MKMKQLGIMLVFVFVLFSCSRKKEQKLLVAAASSLRPVLEDIGAEFNKKEGVSIGLITASSGKLTAQIEAGAPYDVFLSANSIYPKYLQAKLDLKETPVKFANGSVVFLMSKKHNTDQLDIISVLKNEELKRLVIPNPKLAPYGKAVHEALMQLKLYNFVAEKLVFAESVSQANQFLSSRTLDGGFTSLSSVKVKDLESNYKIHFLSDTLYTPIANSLLIVSKNKVKQEKAQKFEAFLQSETVGLILKKYGYTIPK